VAQDWERTAE